ncbi:MAG: hypothetical protein HZB54_00785 [Deltaproteobacteria bacterium]|nr:hypothetical protein [Deltaproteobacteria bacterium]
MKSLFSIKFFYKISLMIALIVFVGHIGFKPVLAASPAQKETTTSTPAKETKPAAPAQAEPAKPAAKKTTTTQVLDPKDPKNILYLNTKGELAGTGDPTKSGPASEAVKAGAGWHPAAMAAAVLPKDKYGLVDWAKAVKNNVIAPRHSLDETEEEMPAMDMNVVIETKSDFINDVVYPHYIHTWWLKCDVCHPKIFVPAKGQNNMTMVDIANGKFCGRCHGKIAFPLTDCTRCHVQPKKAAAAPTAPAPAKK